MDFFLTVIAIAIVAGLAYVAFVEWSKATTDQRWSMIETLVEAAEQTLQGEAGATRKAWVKERLQARFPGLDIEEAEDLIESAVYRLRQRSGVIVIEQPQEPAKDDGLGWFDGTGRQN
jgi:type II secretory pathway pseudopilin PulG